MNEILDEFSDAPIVKIGLFSKLSFFVSILTTLMLIYSVLSIPATISASDTLDYSTLVTNIGYISLLVILGGILTLISVNRKEGNHWVKWTGAMINTLWFALMILGSVL